MYTNHFFLLLSEVEFFCRYCGAFRRRVPLNSMGLCDSCENKRICQCCKFRRQARFFLNNSDICTTCNRKYGASPIRRSVRNIFEEQLLDAQPKAIEVGVVVRDPEDDPPSRLEQQLTEQGFVSYVNLSIYKNSVEIIRIYIYIYIYIYITKI